MRYASRRSGSVISIVLCGVVIAAACLTVAWLNIAMTLRIFSGVGACLAAIGFMARRSARRGEPRPSIDENGLPTLRWADAHPDAPARRPLSAGRDLGEPTPPLSAVIAPVRDVPRHLDVRLADYAPADWTPVPPQDAPCAVRLAPRERLHTFSLPVPAFAGTDRLIDSDDVTSNLPSAAVHDLLAHLECKTADRMALPPMRTDRLEETLGALRRLAAQA